MKCYVFKSYFSFKDLVKSRDPSQLLTQHVCYYFLYKTCCVKRPGVGTWLLFTYFFACIKNVKRGGVPATTMYSKGGGQYFSPPIFVFFPPTTVAVLFSSHTKTYPPHIFMIQFLYKHDAG